MIRVIVADDNAITREGVKVILSKYPDILVAGEARSQLEAFQVVCRGGWDVLLFIFSATPGRDTGIEFLRELKRNDLRYKRQSGRGTDPEYVPGRSLRRSCFEGGGPGIPAQGCHAG